MPAIARIYFAGPLFTQAEWQWNARIADQLRKRAYDIILPQETAAPMLAAQQEFDARALFEANKKGIDEADLVLAVLDQPDADSGTCWECGYAYKLGRPILGLRTDIRRLGDDPNASVNLMLSESCAKLLDVPLNKRDDTMWIVDRVSETINQLVMKH